MVHKRPLGVHLEVLSSFPLSMLYSKSIDALSILRGGIPKIVPQLGGGGRGSLAKDWMTRGRGYL